MAVRPEDADDIAAFVRERQQALEAAIARIDALALACEAQFTALNARVAPAFAALLDATAQTADPQLVKDITARRDALLKTARDLVDEQLAEASHMWDECAAARDGCAALASLVEKLKATGLKLREAPQDGSGDAVRLHSKLLGEAVTEKLDQQQQRMPNVDKVAVAPPPPLLFTFPMDATPEWLVQVLPRALGWVGRRRPWSRVGTAPRQVLEGAATPTPVFLSFTADNNLVIAEQDALVVNKISLSNRQLQRITVEMAPCAVATHPFEDLVWVAVRKNLADTTSEGYIDCYDKTGSLVSSINCSSVHAVAVLPSNDIVVLTHTHELQRFSHENGTEVWGALVPESVSTMGLAVTSGGVVIVVDQESSSLLMYHASDGEPLRTISLASVQLDRVASLGWLWDEDALVIAQPRKLLVVTLQGEKLAEWSTEAPNADPSQAQFDEPSSVAVSTAGHIVVSDMQRRHLLVFHA